MPRNIVAFVTAQRRRAIAIAAVFAILAGLVVVNWLATDRSVTKTAVKSVSDSRTLVVLLHAYQLNGASLDDVKKTLVGEEGAGGFGELAGADVIQPDLPFAMFSMASPQRVVAELLDAIDVAWKRRAEQGRPYTRIVLVGHSLGALLARQLYVVAVGENAAAPFEDSMKEELARRHAPTSGREWAPAIDRIVLLAAMNRGWSVSHHMSLTLAVESQIGVAIGRVLELIHGRPPMMLAVRRGSPFITNLRLQWLAMREQSRTPAAGPCSAVRAAKKITGAAPTVQLLGTVDDLVSPEDNIDLVSGRDFVYIEVPLTGHKNVIDIDESPAGKARAAKLREAFAPCEQLEALSTSNHAAVTPRDEVTDVVFVIHGIRDEGWWTQRIAERARQLGTKLPQRVVETETSTYGYFPMLSFLRPNERREKVEWLMDRYTEARARYPEAKFHYVGHSNGTYLLAEALRKYPAVSFHRVVFAGSVVRRDFDWAPYVPSRVKAVFNFVADADWVVAWFPKALQQLDVQDLGSAGHDGFDAAGRIPDVDQVRYVRGGHSAGLNENIWNDIARFTLTGEKPSVDADLVSLGRKKWVELPGQLPVAVWAVIALVLGAGLWLLVRSNMREWKKTLAVIAYLALVWTVLTEL